MKRRPNPAVTDPCSECLGWGGHTVNNSTDYEDENECTFCRGSGIQKEET